MMVQRCIASHHHATATTHNSHEGSPHENKAIEDPHHLKEAKKAEEEPPLSSPQEAKEAQTYASPPKNDTSTDKEKIEGSLTVYKEARQLGEVSDPKEGTEDTHQPVAKENNYEPMGGLELKDHQHREKRGLVGKESKEQSKGGLGVSNDKAPPPSPLSEKDKGDLFAMYEKLNNSFQDLTFKDLCKTQSKNKHVEPASAMDGSLEFAVALGGLNQPIHEEDKQEATFLTGGVGLRSNSAGVPLQKKAHKEHKPEAVALQRRRGGSSQNSNASSSARTSIATTDGDSIRYEESWAGLTASLHRSSSNNYAIKEGGGGAPHTRYCGRCSKYIFLFKTRCLVCGRCYCFTCVKISMGDMPEGRKCNGCLGRRFKERYIHKAGKGCNFMLSSASKMAEIKWARKKIRRGEDTPSSHGTPIKRHRNFNQRHSIYLTSRTSPLSPRRSNYSCTPPHPFNAIHPTIF